MPGVSPESFTATVEPPQEASNLVIEWNGFFRPSNVTERAPIQLPEAEIAELADSGIEQFYDFLTQQGRVETETAPTPQGRHSSRQLGASALSVSDLLERQASPTPLPAKEAEVTMLPEVPRESRLRRAGRFIRNLLRSGPNLSGADLNPILQGENEEDNQPEGPQTVDFGVRFGVIPEPTFPAQPYPGWDGRDYTVIDEDHIVSRGGEAYLFTHRTPPDAGFNYEVRDTLKRQDLPEKLEGTLVSTQENHDPRNHASIIIREIPREVVAQMGEERAKRLHSDSRLVRVA